MQRFLWPVSHGKTLSLVSATNKDVSSLSWLWRLMRRSIRNLNIPKQPPLAFELFKACLVRFFFCPQQRLPLGIPLSHARFLFLSPQLPYDTKRPLRRREKFSLQITPWWWSNASPEEEMFCKYMVCGWMKSKCFGRLKVSRAYISQW